MILQIAFSTLKKKKNCEDLLNLVNLLRGPGAEAGLLSEGRQSVRRLAVSSLHGGQTVYLSLRPNIPAAFKHSSDSRVPGVFLFREGVCVTSRFLLRAPEVELFTIFHKPVPGCFFFSPLPYGMALVKSPNSQFYLLESADES